MPSTSLWRRHRQGPAWEGVEGGSRGVEGGEAGPARPCLQLREYLGAITALPRPSRQGVGVHARLCRCCWGQHSCKMPTPQIGLATWVGKETRHRRPKQTMCDSLRSKQAAASKAEGHGPVPSSCALRAGGRQSLAGSTASQLVSFSVPQHPSDDARGRWAAGHAPEPRQNEQKHRS